MDKIPNPTKQGRPSKRYADKLQSYVQVSLTEEEMAVLDRLIAVKSMSKSAFLRRLFVKFSKKRGFIKSEVEVDE